MRKKRPLKRVDGVHRDATLIVIASEDRYAVKQYFEFFKSTQIQFRVLETEDGKSSPEQVMNRLGWMRMWLLRTACQAAKAWADWLGL